MVRNYVRKLPPVDKEKMKAAVVSVLRDKLNPHQAAKLHNVKPNTLYDWLKRTTLEQALAGEVTTLVHGHKTVSD